MDNSRKVEVTYTNNRWIAEVAPGYDEPLECGTFQALIDAVQRDLPYQALVFIVDGSTVDGNATAERQLRQASEMSGALIVSSDVRVR